MAQPNSTFNFQLSTFLFLLFSLPVCAYKTHMDPIVLPKNVNIADSAGLYKTLLENAPIEPEFMHEPHFAIVGYGGKFYFSTGARMCFTASVDWINPVTNPTGTGASQITEAYSGNKSLFQMAAGTSSIFFNIIGFPNTQNQIGLFISLGLDAGSDNSYRVKANHIYMRYRNLLCGYTTSLYNDRAADAYSIDGNGPGASGAHNSVQINYQTAVTKNINVGIGLELPKVSVTNFVPKEETPHSKEWYSPYQRVPDVPAYVQYTWKNGSHLRLAGVLRTLMYYDPVANSNRAKLGWGAKLTGAWNIKKLTLRGMFQGGCGIASYMKDLSNENLDLVPVADVEKIGSLTPTYALGLIATAQYDYTDYLFSTLSYSYYRSFKDRYGYRADDVTMTYDASMRHGTYISGNFIWKISPLFSAGLEYIHVIQQREGKARLSSNRLYGMFMMNF